jgi:hypothetical protein
MMEQLDDLILAQTIKEREGEKPKAKEVSLDEL